MTRVPDRAGPAGVKLYENLVRVLHTLYKGLFSPFIGRQCRFTPTCSDYAAEVLITHGPWRGGLLALRRIARCHPWGGSGHDPPPPRP